MVGERTESPSSAMMTEGLLTSSFGSHESVCKPVQPDCGHGGVPGAESSKIQPIRKNVLKVGFRFDLLTGLFHSSVTPTYSEE